MKSPEHSTERWLRPAEAAEVFESAGLFRVPLSTLRGWACAGRIRFCRTAGGHRRYRETDVCAFAASLQEPERAA